MNSEKKTDRRRNPRANANILSKITFWYTLPLLVRGFKHELEEDDLYDVLPDYKSQVLGDRIEDEWRKLKKPSMFQLAWKLTGKYYILLGLTKIVEIVLNVLRPVVMAKFVSYFVPGQTEQTKPNAFYYGFLLIALSIADILYRHNYFMAVESLAIKLRAAVCSLLYRKSLKLSVQNLQNVPFGKLENLMTRDVSSFDTFFVAFNNSWTGFISTIIICYNMYQKIGLAVFVVILAYVIMIPCLAVLGFKMASLKTASSEMTDKRINTFREMLCKIRSTKMYVWEKILEERISADRRKEMNILLKMYIAMFFILSGSTLILHLTHYCVLMLCIWLGQTLTAETIYFVTGCFQSITFNITVAIPYTTYTATQFSAALKRLQTAVEELDMEAEKLEDTENATKEPNLKVRNLTLRVDKKEVLKNISFDLGKGLTLLLGHASVGKTTLLLTILGEFEATEGSVHTEGRVSYVCQEPWLFPSTIKQNILFGAKYDAKRYHEVVEVCALEYDFQTFENGDDTVVAEQGINLSRGQQSRVCLARAIYKESDIYLLDDCLANLDPLVSDTIFKKCIMTHLKDKLVVLVTSNLKLVPYAKNVITLTHSEAKFSKIEPQESKLSSSANCRNSLQDLDRFEMEENTNEESKLITQQTTQCKVYGETKKDGSVSLNTYRRYVDYGGGKISVMLILCVFLIGQFSISYKDKLISDWANLEQQIVSHNSSTDNIQYEELLSTRRNTIYIYTAVIAIIVSVILLRAYFLFVFSKNASVKLHKAMLNSVINATMSFFDRTYIGNIVNRFSKDLVTTDESIPFTLLYITAILFEVGGVSVLILTVNIAFLTPILVFFIIVTFLRHAYLKTGRALKRLGATTKSPIVGYINAALRGLPTIRTFRAQNILKKEFDKCQDLHSSASYCHLSCMKAYVFAVDNLSPVFIALIILKFLLFDKDVTAGDVGLAVSQASIMCSVLYFGFYQWAELETQMTSAERAFEYTDIKKERKQGLLLENWPKQGGITFGNVFLSFDNCKSYVLNNLNFSIQAGEKVGIVGRTGAGKSSIFSTLFRLYEFEGSVTIDGINIKNLSLNFLRSKISIIPQDPLVFNGTFRYNIDPEGAYSDEELWKVVETVKLKPIFPSLDTYIAEEELSFAQKQLICMARVFLSDNRILLLDEIIENGDSDTENLIYDLIDKHFEMCTVIRITHKMRFVMNCDRVLVMDKGQVVDYDSPQNLLQNRSGLFYKMVKKSG